MSTDGNGAPSVSVIIATLGRAEPLKRAIQSLLRSHTAPSEVLVVDGSAEGDARGVTAHFGQSPSPVRHIVSTRGSSHQRNVGMAMATGDVVLFLDDDARVTPDVLTQMIYAFADPAVVGVTGRIIEPPSNRVAGKGSRLRVLFDMTAVPGTFSRSGYPHRLFDESATQDVQFMQGAFMSARRSPAVSVGFDELLTGYGLAEDEDFSYRLSRIGRIRYLGDAHVHHDNRGFGARDRREFSRQVIRHRRYLFEKNFPQTRLARLDFFRLECALVLHRLLNGDLVGARSLLGAILRRDRLPVSGATTARNLR